MKKNTKTNRLFVMITAVLFPLAVFASSSKVYQIPRIDGIIIDGSGDDWAKRGFHVDFLSDPDGRALPAEDFDVKFRLGWNKRGLLLLVFVSDDVPAEHEEQNRLWRQDCVEAFVSQEKGATNRYQLVVASGADQRYKKVRSRLYDWRHQGEKHTELSVKTASHVFDGGYIIEALFPWENLGVKPGLGMELAFQLTANDFDGSKDADNSLRVAWYPGIGPRSRDNFYRIKLSDKASAAVLYRTDRRINFSGCTLTIRGSKEMAGKSVVIQSSGKVITREKMALKNGRANLQYNFNKSRYKKSWPKVDVIIEGQTINSFEKMATLDHVYESYIQALGGRAAIEKLLTRRVVGKLVNDLS